MTNVNKNNLIKPLTCKRGYRRKNPLMEELQFMMRCRRESARAQEYGLLLNK